MKLDRMDLLGTFPPYYCFFHPNSTILPSLKKSKYLVAQWRVSFSQIIELCSLLLIRDSLYLRFFDKLSFTYFLMDQIQITYNFLLFCV